MRHLWAYASFERQAHAGVPEVPRPMRQSSKRCICPEMAHNPTDSYLSTATVLDHPQQEHQVITSKTFTITTILRKNLRLYAPSGAYNSHNNQISLRCPGSSETYNKTYTENIASKKVTSKK